jgi:hypothetical protein
VLAMLCNKGKQTNLGNFPRHFRNACSANMFRQAYKLSSFRPTMKKSLFNMTTVVQKRQAAYTCWTQPFGNWTGLCPQMKGWGPTQYPVWATTLSTNRVILHILRLKSSGSFWAYGIPLWGIASNSNIEIFQRYQNKVLRAILNAPSYISNKVF